MELQFERASFVFISALIERASKSLSAGCRPKSDAVNESEWKWESAIGELGRRQTLVYIENPPSELCQYLPRARRHWL